MAVSMDPTMTLKDLARAKEELNGADHVWCVDPTGRVPLAYSARPGFEVLGIVDRVGGLVYKGQLPLTYEELAMLVEAVL
ncbi:MAG: hypothetical protein HY688_01750 [Chloroflexi bacterium]|nr:hypothetical protein [Chloroflexota bacterium]